MQSILDKSSQETSVILSTIIPNLNIGSKIYIKYIGMNVNFQIKEFESYYEKIHNNKWYRNNGPLVMEYDNNKIIREIARLNKGNDKVEEKKIGWYVGEPNIPSINKILSIQVL